MNLQKAIFIPTFERAYDSTYKTFFVYSGKVRKPLIGEFYWENLGRGKGEVMRNYTGIDEKVPILVPEKSKK